MSEMSIPWAVQELTKGQPFAFVAMAYPRAEHAQTFQHVYSVIHEVVTERFGMACVRADAVPGSGHDLLAKLHYLMEQADLVIADISEDRPNVFYEIGYAVGRGKPPLLVCRRGRDVPTDLRGLEVIEYGEGWDGPAEFRRQLESHLKVLVGAELPILSDMLLAPNPRPAYIVAGSRYATQQAQSVGQSYHHRTFGDRLGILGLVSTFGALMGGAGAIELISAKYSPPDLLGRNINLYFIGAPKVNYPAGLMLALLQNGREPRFLFGAAPGHSECEEDWVTALYEVTGGQLSLLPSRAGSAGDDERETWVEDWGIIIRGPHPDYRDRIAMVMAGAHSLGTGAACLAATRSPLIAKIRSKLPPGTLEDKSNTIWVKVRGRASQEDHLLDTDGVEVVAAGVYE